MPWEIAFYNEFARGCRILPKNRINTPGSSRELRGFKDVFQPIPGPQVGTLLKPTSLAAFAARLETESTQGRVVRHFWCYLIVLAMAASGCGSKPAPEAANAKKTPKRSTPNYKAPGPASKQRDSFNKGGEGLGNGANEIFIKDLQSSNIGEVKTAIEHLQGVGAKGAIPQLETLAKSHKDADIRRRVPNGCRFAQKTKVTQSLKKMSSGSNAPR